MFFCLFKLGQTTVVFISACKATKHHRAACQIVLKRLVSSRFSCENVREVKTFGSSFKSLMFISEKYDKFQSVYALTKFPATFAVFLGLFFSS